MNLPLCTRRRQDSSGPNKHASVPGKTCPGWVNPSTWMECQSPGGGGTSTSFVRGCVATGLEN